MTETKLIESLEGGKIVVIRPLDMSTVVPLFCSACDFPMKTADDSISFRKHGVCSHCDGRWTSRVLVWADKEKWPDKASDAWVEYITLRALYSRALITFR